LSVSVNRVSYEVLSIANDVSICLAFDGTETLILKVGEIP